MIRVGRRIYERDGSFNDPEYANFEPIMCLTKSTQYGSLGPYVLKTKDDCIMENAYQFSRLYQKVPEVKLKYSRYSKKITWDRPEEVHVENKKITDAYWKWRNDGMHNADFIRYPVGFNNKSDGLCALVKNGNSFTPLGYVEARKQIYLPLYSSAVKQQSQFEDLLSLLDMKRNILIIEVDGPHGEDLQYYKDKYDVDDTFIENNTMLVNKKNIEIMLNDTKHPFGHCYCLAMNLLGHEIDWNCGAPIEPDERTLGEYKIIKNYSGYCICNPSKMEFWHIDSKKPIGELTIEDFSQ